MRTIEEEPYTSYTKQLKLRVREDPRRPTLSATLKLFKSSSYMSMGLVDVCLVVLVVGSFLVSIRRCRGRPVGRVCCRHLKLVSRESLSRPFTEEKEKKLKLKMEVKVRSKKMAA